MRRLAALLCLGLAACAAGPGQSGPGEAMAAFESRAESCKAAYPFEPPPESARRMAPGEQAYRDCLHAAVETLLIPALPYDDLRDGYRALLAEDRRLGDEVAAGRLSRAEHRARIDERTAHLAGQWRREAEMTRRSRANAEQMDALQRQLTIIDDLVRRGRR
jgi:hypothetical protein